MLFLGSNRYWTVSVRFLYEEFMLNWLVVIELWLGQFWGLHSNVITCSFMRNFDTVLCKSKQWIEFHTNVCLALHFMSFVMLKFYAKFWRGLDLLECDIMLLITFAWLLLCWAKKSPNWSDWQKHQRCTCSKGK